MADTRETHTFANGVTVHRSHLLPKQIERYQRINYHEPDEEPVFAELLERMDPAGPFYDIGAAIGYYAILARKRHPGMRIVAFEPNDDQRRNFLENLELNGIPAADLDIRTVAVSNFIGTSRFTLDNYGSSLVRKSDRFRLSRIKRKIKALLGRGKPPKRVVEVPTTTLDELLRQEPSRIELAKVDVQGFEVEVLEGAARALREGKVRRWLIGTHKEIYHQECLRWLKESGYQIDFETQEVSEQPDGVISASRL